jgi:hypothetical protein
VSVHRLAGRQVADLVCSACHWHVSVWREPPGPGIVQSNDLHGPADMLFSHIEVAHPELS